MIGIFVAMGGPDGYGYRYLSTQDGDPVPFNWIEISTTGTPLGASDDWCSGSSAGMYYSLGFPFPYYADTVDSISVCSNGTVLLQGISNYLGLSNYPLPYTSGPGFVAVMWDDLDPPEYGGDVYFQSFASCPDGYGGACAVVEWHNVPRFGNTTLMDFEVIFYDNGNIKLQYNSVIYYDDATVGIQDIGATTSNGYYLEYVYNGSPSGHVPNRGVAVMFYYSPPSDYNVGVLAIAPSGRVDLTPITFTATVENSGFVPTTSTDIILNIYDTTTSTLAFSDTQTVAIPETSTVEVTFAPFTPSLNRVYRVEAVAVDPGDTVHNNDTTFTFVHTFYLFGDIVEEWQFPRLGDSTGYSFAGMTYAPDSGKFYVATLNPRGVYWFDPHDPYGTLQPASFTLHNFFGSDDYVWGIAYGNGAFYVSHFGYDGSAITGSKIGYYDGDGNLVDSLDVWASIESGGYMAGMDWDPASGLLWGVYAGGSNSVYKVDVTLKDAAGTFPNASGGALSDISVFYPLSEVYYGGFRVSRIFQMSYSGSLLRQDTITQVAGMDVWAECTSPEDPVYLFVALNDMRNTLLKIGTGHTCADVVNVAERRDRKPSTGIKVIGRTIAVEGQATVYDISGRKVATFDSNYTVRHPGVYFVKVKGHTFRVVIR